MLKVLEDNSRALEMATIQKTRYRTTHLNMKLHHFIDYVTHGEVTILSIGVACCHWTFIHLHIVLNPNHKLDNIILTYERSLVLYRSYLLEVPWILGYNVFESFVWDMALTNHNIKNMVGSAIHHLQSGGEGKNIRVRIFKRNKE